MAEQISYKPLKESFTKYGFDFKMIKRTKKKAIFAQTKGSKTYAYEAVVISKHDGFYLGENYIEPSETYPCNSDWGTKGFTYKTLEEAEEKYKTL
jgi:hypothetical protein